MTNFVLERLKNEINKYEEQPTKETAFVLKSLTNELYFSFPKEETEIVEVDMGRCRIQFYEYDGSIPKVGDKEDIIRSYMWQLTGEGIDSMRVRSVELPVLRYDGEPDSLKLKVEYEV